MYFAEITMYKLQFATHSNRFEGVSAKSRTTLVPEKCWKSYKNNHEILWINNKAVWIFFPCNKLVTHSYTVLESKEWRACPNSWKRVSTSQWLSLRFELFDPGKLQTRATTCSITDVKPRKTECNKQLSMSFYSFHGTSIKYNTRSGNFIKDSAGIISRLLL